jgi:hypothetical protein
VLTVGAKLDRAAKAALLASTLAWFRSDDDEPCSFVFCCDALGLDVDLVRERVKKLSDGSVKIKVRPRRLPADAHLDILRSLENGSATTSQLGGRHHCHASTCRN